MRMNNEYVIWFNHEKCTQCHGCEVACRSWRGLEGQGLLFRRVINVWRGNYPDAKNHSVSLSCLHCVEPACAAVCPVEAITKREKDGVVAVDEALCIGCKTCLDACPYGVPCFASDGVMKKCDLCLDQAVGESGPPCVATCPGDALSFRKVDPKEKEAHLSYIFGLLE
ncbi:dimethylsulfoxide reductase subunit B [Desulfocicer niacini]